MKSLKTLTFSEGFALLDRLKHYDPTVFLDHCQSAEIVQLKFPSVFILNSPELIKELLLHDIKSFSKSFHYKEFNPVLGKGLITSDGAEWESGRKAVGGFFSPNQVASYQSLIEQCTNSHIEQWLTRQQSHLDCWNDLLSLTFDIIAQVVFGHDLKTIQADARECFDQFSELSVERMFMPIKLPRFIPIKNHLKMRRCSQKLKKMAILLTESPDFLPQNLLKKLLSQQHTALSPEKIKDEAITLLAAGYETMGAALYWTLYLLTQHPNKLKELEQSLNNNDDIYLDCVLHEALRLYPTVPLVSRSPTHPGNFHGINLNVKQVFMIPLFSLHRNPLFWSDPQEFMPERFLKVENLKSPAYMPFLKGARKCIGEYLAMLVLKNVLKLFFKRCRIHKFHLHQDIINHPKIFITLKPCTDLRLHIESR